MNAELHTPGGDKPQTSEYPLDLVDLEEVARGGPVPERRTRYRLRIDQESYVISNGAPTGAELLALAGKSGSEWCLFQKLKGGAEEHVDPTERVDLLARGVERFETKRAAKLCIEGKDFPWCLPTITAAEIIKLGGWEPSQGIIEVDENQNERTLAPDEVIHLRPGKEYGKRHCWKRGAL